MENVMRCVIVLKWPLSSTSAFYLDHPASFSSAVLRAIWLQSLTCSATRGLLALFRNLFIIWLFPWVKTHGFNIDRRYATRTIYRIFPQLQQPTPSAAHSPPFVGVPIGRGGFNITTFTLPSLQHPYNTTTFAISRRNNLTTQ